MLRRRPPANVYYKGKEKDIVKDVVFERLSLPKEKIEGVRALDHIKGEWKEMFASPRGGVLCPEEEVLPVKTHGFISGEEYIKLTCHCLMKGIIPRLEELYRDVGLDLGFPAEFDFQV
jgi:hypothetical protein